MLPKLPFERPKRALIPIGVALSLIAAAVAVDQFGRADAKKGSPEFPTRMAAISPVLEPARSSLALRPELAAPPEAPLVREEPLGLDEFIGLLEAKVPKPLAAKVAKEFMKEPMLKEAWKQYKKKRGDKGKGAEFVDFVTRLPQFRQLMAKFQSDPSFKAAFGEVAKTPKLDAVIREGLGAIKKHKGVGPVDQAAIAREWERKARSGVDTGVGSSGGGAGPSRHFTPAHTSPDRQGPSHIAGGGGNQALSGQSLGGAHDVDVLGIAGKIKTAGPGESKDGWKKDESGGYVRAVLKWLEDNGYKSDRLAIEAMLGQEGFWGACFMTGHFELCRKGCGVAESQGTPCVAVTKWDACMGDAEKNAGVRTRVQCIQECVTRYGGKGCADESAWQAECALGKANIGCEYCSAAYDYGPEECDADGNCWVNLGCHGRGEAGAPTKRQTLVAPPKEVGCDAACIADIVSKALANATAEWDAKQAAKDAEWQKKLDERDARIKELEDKKKEGEGEKKKEGEGEKKKEEKCQISCADGSTAQPPACKCPEIKCTICCADGSTPAPPACKCPEPKKEQCPSGQVPTNDGSGCKKKCEGFDPLCWGGNCWGTKGLKFPPCET